VAGRQGRLRALFFLVIAAGTIGLSLASDGFGLFGQLERQSVDERFAIRGALRPPADVEVVKIDDVTFGDLQRQWPFPRSLHAKVLDRIRAGHPRAIVYDVQFTEPTTPAEDNALIDAVARARGRIVLSTTEVGPHGSTGIFGGGGILKEIGARAGNGNVRPDSDGVVRKVDYESQGLDSLSVVAAQIALGHPVRHLRPGGHAWIDFVGPPGAIPSVSFSRVLLGGVPAATFRNKIVVVGATAPSLQDIHAVSTGPAMAGPELQANAILTALRGFPLRSVPQALDVVLIVLLGLVAPLVGLRAGPILSSALAALAGGLFAVGTQLAFDHGWVVSFVYPLEALALSAVGAIVMHYLVAAVERERVRDTFSRFVPEGVVDQVLAHAGGDLRLRGTKVTATALFSDLRGFTTSAEDMDAAEVIDILNVYFDEMTEAILANGGTLVSYIGDGIYAVFGAPIEQEDHADRALAAAREMLVDRLPRFNARVRERGLEGYRMGIGLNTGPVMCGNVGHARRLEYTVVGDTANAASRIEGLTKGTPYPLLLAESTYAGLQSPPADLEYVDEVEIRGRQRKLRLWGFRPPEEIGARTGGGAAHDVASPDGDGVPTLATPLPPAAGPEQAGS
jgi:adenylate cyclase